MAVLAKLLALAAIAVVALAAPATIQRPPKDGMRLIATAPTVAVWMTEEEVFNLIKADIQFIDKTDHQLLGTVIRNTQRVAIPTTPTHQDVVKSFIENIDIDLVRSNLVTLSAFNNRYYNVQSGAESADWIYQTALAVAGNRSDISVAKFPHSWAQPSVIARIEGTSARTDFVVLGAHQDSINGLSPQNGRAPGADDDGSGSMTIMEVFRLLSSTGFRPEIGIEFQWFAAEEVGLRGSQAIAQQYASDRKVVRAMMQIDMDGYSPNNVVAIVTDYTDAELNVWMRTLVDEYLNISWIDTRCNYGCSDHASFTAAGYPAAFPFEADFSDISPFIHTAQDTIETVDFNHVYEYVKLGLGFVIETSYDN
jgi:leucyl aminopeptidase